jgi:hypothetical protein
MVRVVFKYKDEMSNGEWREQECIVSSVEECRSLYGLDGSDPTLIDYKIIKVEEW